MTIINQDQTNARLNPLGYDPWNIYANDEPTMKEYIDPIIPNQTPFGEAKKVPTYDPGYEKAGYEMGRKFGRVFQVREDVTTAELTDLSMQFVEWHSDTARNAGYAMSFVKGCNEGLRGSQSTSQMTMEEKINWLVQREIKRGEQVLEGPKDSSNGPST